MKRWSLLFLVVGLLVGVVAGLLLDKGVSAQAGVRGSVMYLHTDSRGTQQLDAQRPPEVIRRGAPVQERERAVAYCFTGGGGIHCLPAR